jgi:hypothetical protein
LFNSINFQTFALFCFVAAIASGSSMLTAFYNGNEDLGFAGLYMLLSGLIWLLGNVNMSFRLTTSALAIGVSLWQSFGIPDAQKRN